MNIFDIPIITYHKISTLREFGVTTITPDIFKKQLELLKKNGYKSITFKQFSKNSNIPDKPVIISFDDTYESVYENAFPIMQELNFKGVLFVISDYIGKKNLWEAYPIQRKHFHANKEQINEMIVNGFEIGSHSKSHKYLPFLEKKDIFNEINDSKQYLEETFKTQIFSCCYPYGGHSKLVLSEAKSAGYIYGMGNLKFSLNNSENTLSLQRRSIYSTDSISIFLNKITSTTKASITFISEWVIQKGAYTGIWKNRLTKI